MSTKVKAHTRVKPKRKQRTINPHAPDKVAKITATGATVETVTNGLRRGVATFIHDLKPENVDKAVRAALENKAREPSVQLEVTKVMHELKADIETAPPVAVPQAVQAMCVYLDTQRHTAKVGRTVITFLSLGLDNGIELKRWDVRDFVQSFVLCLPNYPVRRAARIFNASTLNKSDSAALELRKLLA